MPPHIRFAPFSRLMFSNKVAALAAAAAFVIVLGCTGIDFRPDPSPGTVPNYEQEGTVTVAPNSTLEVFYPFAYFRPPTLTISDWHHDCITTEYKENSFRLRNRNATWERTVTWKARGLLINSPCTPPPTDWVPSVPEDGPPPAPTPGAVMPQAKLGQPR